jgi:large subunit ribosomal protein L23
VPTSEQMNHYRTIILQPVISEKSMAASERGGSYQFKVMASANKVEIGQAIEALFNVRVRSVNTLMVKGKARRRSYRQRLGRTAGWKKAIVQLAPGDRIDVVGAG